LALALQYPVGFQFVKVPDPLSGLNPTYPLTTVPVPAVGVPFFDSRFGTIKTRATQTDSYNSRHEYSRFDPFNVDQSMIVLPTTDGDWNVYRTQTMPYNTTASLVRHFDMREPRWDASNPTLLWGLEDFSIVTLDVQSDIKTVIKDFTADSTIGPIISANPVYWITTREEGESSLDKRYWVFILQGDTVVYLFTWDRQLDQVPGICQLSTVEADLVDYVGMSPLGNYAIIGADPSDTATIAGLMMANRELTQLHKLGYAIGHSDVGLDSDGNEVIVGQNTWTDYIELTPIDFSTSPVENPAGYGGSGCIPLIRLFYDNQSPYGFQSGVHISCNYPGYAVVSTYIEPALPEQNWLDRSIVLVKLNRVQPRVSYLAKVHNTTQAYWEETHATITNDGKKVVWASNWDQNVGQEQMFLMQLDMPANWSVGQATATNWLLYP